MDWWHIPVLVVYAVCLTAIFLYTLMQTHLLFIYRKSRKTPKSMGAELTDHPHVTVQLPVYNEKYVVSRLLRSVAGLDWPKEKLEIQLLDDSTDETTSIARKEIEELRQDGLNIIHIHRDSREGFKAGALEFGLKRASGEFIAVFDSDFVPNADFLKQTVPLFQDSGIGMVQAKWTHLNEDASMLTRMQAYALNAHFTIEQKGRNAGGFPMNFNGTAGIWRKHCIQDAGGWQADTLTEDLDLSYRAQLKGWKFHFLDELAAPAELPVAVQALKTQQYRWTKGAAETCRKHLFGVWGSDWPMQAKIHATSHLMSGSIFFFILMLAILSIPLLIVKSQRPDLSAWFWSFTALSLGIIAWFAFYMTANQDENPSLKSHLVRFPLFLSYSMGMSLHNSMAAWKGWLGRSSDFIRTPKFNLSGYEFWSLNSYLKPEMGWLPLAEAALSLYFLSGFVLAVQTGDFGLLPFHLMLAFGFGSISYYSLSEYLMLKKTQRYASA
jgi:cellulose synthase/poly-beta-1,6-N-acetylglucosamine synthase-like glycosyltransferase